MNRGQITANRDNWTLNDYLDNDPEALKVIAQTKPDLFKKLNDDHYSKPVIPGVIAAVKNEPEPNSPAPANRANWTLSDYLENDPGALVDIAQNKPELFKKLNDDHYGR